MPDSEFKKRETAAPPTFNALLELVPPAQRPLLLSHFTEAANAKTANEFFEATDKIADLLRLRKTIAHGSEETFSAMFGFNRGQAHNAFGFDYNHNADTAKEAFATKGFNCLSGNLIMAKLADELLKTNGKLEGSVSMRVVIGTLASFSGGHVIAKADVEGQTRYYDMTNTSENGTLITPVNAKNLAKTEANYVYFLGKEFAIDAVEEYSKLQQKIRNKTTDGFKTIEKDFEGVPVELLPYAIKLISIEDAMSMLSKLGYETPADLTVKIKDNETRISIALYLMEGYLKLGETEVAKTMVRDVAENFNAQMNALDRMKISHETEGICKAYDIMKENGEPEAASVLYKIILFAGAARPIASIDDAQEIAKRIEKGDTVVGTLRFMEIIAINATLTILPVQGTEEFNLFAMRRLNKRFYENMQNEGIDIEKIMAIDQDTRRTALDRLFRISIGSYETVNWNPLQRGALLSSFIQPNTVLMEKYDEYMKSRTR